jgi:xanthine dehydrogenase accessory factor
MGAGLSDVTFHNKLGSQADRIDRIACPIGDRSLGKHPQAIAIGVAAALMRTAAGAAASPDVPDAPDAPHAPEDGAAKARDA